MVTTGKTVVHWESVPTAKNIVDMLDGPEVSYHWDMLFDYANFYNHVVSVTPKQSTLVEIGCYVGESLSHLAVEAYKKDRSIRVVGVDWGLGIPLSTRNDDTGHLEWSSTGVTASTLVVNMRRTMIPNSVPVLMWDSALSASYFNNRSCFMAYIDADHGTEAVRRDILAWMPKIQRGGILCGHDYDLPSVKAAVDGVFHVACADTQCPVVWAMQRTMFGWKPLARS